MGQRPAAGDVDRPFAAGRSLAASAALVFSGERVFLPGVLPATRLGGLCRQREQRAFRQV